MLDPRRNDPVIVELRERLAARPHSVALRLELALAYAGRRCVDAATETLEELLDEGLPPVVAPNGLAEFVEPLADLVTYEDPALRQTAAEILGQLGDGRAAPALVRLGATGSDPFDFDSAFTALMLLSETAVPALARLARDGDDLSARFAVLVLGAIGEPSHRVLIELYQAGVRRGDVLTAMATAGAREGLHCAIDGLRRGDGLAFPAVTALSALAGPDSRDAVAPLIDAMNGEDCVIGAVAADALGEIGDAQALPPLLLALGRDDAELRARAARALGRLGCRTALPELRIALDDPVDQVRGEAAGAILDLAGPRSALWTEALDELLELVTRPGDPEAYHGALEGLGRHEEGIRRLRVLGRMRDDRLRLAGMLALAELEIDDAPDTLKPGLTQALRSKDPVVRCWAAENLYRVADVFDDADVLHDLIADGEPAVRGALAAAIGDLAPMGRIDPLPLLRALVRDPEERVRIEAATALGECGESAVGILGDCTRDPSEPVRAEAVSSLAAMGEEAVPGLTRFLYDPHTHQPRDQASNIVVCDRDTREERRLLASEALRRIDSPRARRAFLDWQRRREA